MIPFDSKLEESLSFFFLTSLSILSAEELFLRECGMCTGSHRLQRTKFQFSHQSNADND